MMRWLAVRFRDVMAQSSVKLQDSQVGDPGLAERHSGLELIRPVDATKTECMLLRHRARPSPGIASRSARGEQNDSRQT
jgi:hypothetical protein